MLSHFVGCCHFGPSTGLSAVSELDRIASQFRWPMWRSKDGRYGIAGNCLHLPGAEEGADHSLKECVSAVAGLLLLNDSSNGSAQAETDRRSLVRNLAAGTYESLASANGTFAAAFYDQNHDTLFLCADSLGARPIYYTSDTKCLWFSTSFNLLGKVSSIRPSLGLEAVAEQFAFCYPLRDRTLAQRTKVLRDNEFLIATRSDYRVNRYYDWKTVGCSPRNIEEEIETCKDALIRAVLARKTDEECQYALLSGGLDSRCIVALLRAGDVEVRTATLGAQDSLDYIYAQTFARETGVPVFHVSGGANLPALTPGGRTQELLSRATTPFRGHAVFSGDGGGETLGLLIMASDVVTLLQQHKVENALRLFSSEGALPPTILTKAAAAIMLEQPYLGMKEEFDELSELEPVKAFQLFLLRNDLRRHLHDYFGGIDENTCELLLPFYDRRVIASVLRIAPPLDDYIRHSFYYKFLKYLPESVMAVRWQAYPKSLPCPLPGSDDAPDQWKLGASAFSKARAAWRNATITSILRGDRLHGIVRRDRVLGAAAVDALRLRKYGYVFMDYLALLEICKQLDRGGVR